MRNPQDTKNLLLLNKLVKNHFSLTNESQRLFKYRTLYEPTIAPEYKAIIGDAPDLRKRFKVNHDILKQEDEGWNIFSYQFADFVGEMKMTYKDFTNGKVLIGKNNIKLFKAVYNYYTSKLSRLPTFINRCFNEMADVEYTGIVGIVKKHLIKIIGKGEIDIADLSFLSYTDAGRIVLKINFLSEGDLKSSTIQSQESYGYNMKYKSYNHTKIPIKDIFSEEELLNFVKKAITNTFDRIGSFSFPKKEVELVISCNPVDMFMASTREDWSSCISVDSDYEEKYWTGLPGAVIDKNRAIVYITDGKKKHYCGIEIDRFLVRSWILTLRNKKTNKSFLDVIGEYPINVGLNKVLSEIGLPEGIDIMTEKYDDYNYQDSGKCISRYYFETLFHKAGSSNKLLSYFYSDSTTVKFAKKNKGVLFPFSYAYHKAGGGHHFLVVHKDNTLNPSSSSFYWEDNGSLTTLIKDNVELRIIDDDEPDEPDHEENVAIWNDNAINNAGLFNVNVADMIDNAVNA